MAFAGAGAVFDHTFDTWVTSVALTGGKIRWKFDCSTNFPFHPGLCDCEAMSKIIFEILDEDTEGEFVAHALGYSIVTQADTWEELLTKVRDAVRCHFEEGEAPRVIRLLPP